MIPATAFHSINCCVAITSSVGHELNNMRNANNISFELNHINAYVM